MDPKKGETEIKDSIVITAVKEVISLLSPEQKAVILELLANEKKQKKAADAHKMPVSIFSTRKVSGLEAVSKYLKEEAKLDFKQIAKMLNRNEVTIRTSCKRASMKHPGRLDISNYSLVIPVKLFSDRSKSVLEIIVSYLHNHYNVSLKEIARLLQRSYKTIWTVYSKSRKKKEDAGR